MIKTVLSYTLSFAILLTICTLLAYYFPYSNHFKNIVFEDFESGNYQNWTTEGNCFGKAPAKGTLAGQTRVKGFYGKGLVNTFLGGDKATGKAISKPFTIDKRYILFLIGGGNHPKQTAINLIVDDKIVRSASGKNKELLLPHYWDVTEYLGQNAQIEIVDSTQKGWGHIIIDQITFSNSTIFPTEEPQTKREKYIISLLWGLLSTSIILLAWGMWCKSDGVMRFALLLLFLILLAVLYRTAWMSDDAYITLRTVDNFVNGYGLRFNVAERVQAYTHPLWMFLLAGAYYFTREAFLTPLILSLVVSASAIYIALWQIASSTLLAFLGGIILLFSRSFIDFSSSGLENPLTHLLLALFVLAYLPKTSESESSSKDKQLFRCSLIAGLLTLNRMDTLLLVAPPLALLWWQNRTLKGTAVVLLGCLPFLLWTIFSIIYYGFPFPNTAYAKLGSGISNYDLVVQGLRYFIATFHHDPFTISAICFAIIEICLSGRKEKIALAIGTSLYLIYIIRIGGCFMAGRFFTPVLFLTTLLIMRTSTLNFPKSTFTTIAVLLCLGSYTSHIPLQNDTSFGKHGTCKYKHGIIDERSFYFQGSGLITNDTQGKLPQHPWANRGRRLKEAGRPVSLIKPCIGMLGAFAGPDIFIEDVYGLADPLLARLPIKNNLKWRIGHFRRQVPPGYTESIQLNKNLLKDEDLALYYDHIRKITRESLFSKERWKSIIKINSGQLNHLIKCYACHSQ